MEKTMLAAAVSLALAGSVATAADIPGVIEGNPTYTQAKDSAIHVAVQDHDIQGATGAETLTIEGSYTGGIYATTGNVTVDKLAGLSIHIKNIEEKNDDINGLHAKGEHTLTVNVGSLSLVAQGNQTNSGPHGPQSPVMIHAYGGNVNVDVSDNIDIAADEGNAVMVQHADAHDAKLVMRAGGDISISSEESSALLVGVLQENDNKSTLKMEARNITIRGGYIGLQVYNNDLEWGGGYGDPCAEISAHENVEIYGDLYGIYSESPSAKTTITANGNVTVEGGQSALVVQNRSDQDTSEQSVTFMAPEVSLVLQGQNDATKAALDQAKGTNVVFEGVGGGATDVTIRAGNGKNAVSIGTNGTLAATNATLRVVQGNVDAANGNMALTNSTVELGNDVTMDLGTLTGEGNTIVFNSTKAGAVKIATANNDVTVLASGRANDQFVSAAQLLSAMEGEEGVSDGIVQVGGTGKTTLGAEAGAVSGAWALNEDGQIVEEENAGLSAFREFSTATFAQWRLENNHLSQRLGDLRADLGKSGAWARVYGGESKITDGVDVKLQTTSVQVGADTTVAGNWIVGGAFTYTNLDADISNGTGDSDSYSLAAYATGLFDCGGYVDVIGRVGRISTDISASTLSASGGVLDGSYDNTTFGLSAEVGYHWKLTDTFYAEPQVELAYGYVLGDDFSASNGAKVSQDDFQSLVGRFGARVGANFAQDKGSLYLHASVNHDFLGDVDGTARAGARTESLDGDLGGTWVSYGIGAQFNTDADLNFYGMLERSHGNDYTDSYRYSVGMRYVF